MARGRPQDLSPREVEVLKNIGLGKTDKETASDMGIAYGTVKSYIKSLMLRLRARNRTHALIKYMNRK